MNPIKLLRLGTRLARFAGTLQAAVEKPALYRDDKWTDKAAHEAADLIAVVPMPSPTRTKAMNLLGLIQNIYKKPVTTLAGVGIAYLEILQNGLTPKAAAIALIGVLLGGTHAGLSGSEPKK